MATMMTFRNLVNFYPDIIFQKEEMLAYRYKTLIFFNCTSLPNFLLFYFQISQILEPFLDLSLPVTEEKVS